MARASNDLPGHAPPGGPAGRTDDAGNVIPRRYFGPIRAVVACQFGRGVAPRVKTAVPVERTVRFEK